MKTFVYSISILVALCVSLTAPSVAFAECTYQTVYTPDGRQMVCQTCCFEGRCTTNCIQ